MENIEEILGSSLISGACFFIIIQLLSLANPRWGVRDMEIPDGEGDCILKSVLKEPGYRFGIAFQIIRDVIPDNLK